MHGLRIGAPVRAWDRTVVPLAILSLGAAMIHFAVMADHVREWWLAGAFFAALGWFQALWSVGYVVRPSIGLVGAAIAVNALTVVIWAWSRTLGLPFGPDPGVAEAVGAPDVLATLLEVVLVIGLVVGRPPPGIGERWRRRAILATVALAAVVVGMTSAAIAMGGS